MFDNQPNFNPMRRRPARKFLLIPFGIAAMVLLLGAAVQYLWNNILTPVVGVGTLTFWQAAGLLVLCRLLFGGMGGKGGGWNSNARRGRWANPRNHWMNMSEEERARFKEEWRERCRPRGRDKG